MATRFVAPQSVFNNADGNMFVGTGITAGTVNFGRRLFFHPFVPPSIVATKMGIRDKVLTKTTRFEHETRNQVLSGMKKISYCSSSPTLLGPSLTTTTARPRPCVCQTRARKSSAKSWPGRVAATATTRTTTTSVTKAAEAATEEAAELAAAAAAAVANASTG